MNVVLQVYSLVTVSIKKSCCLPELQLNVVILFQGTMTFQDVFDRKKQQTVDAFYALHFF